MRQAGAPAAWLRPGQLAALAILALVSASLLGLARAGGTPGILTGLSPYLARLIAGAALQAGLSTLLSFGLGAALALALTRRDFAGRDVLLALLSAAAVVPTIVVVFGVVAIYGRSGLLGMAARGSGIEPPSIYGLSGILIAHVLMNAPLVVRALLQAFRREPGERRRLAAALGLSPWQCFRHLDWPVLRREGPALAAFVFLLCFTSFAVVLSLGGGPGYATLEVAIYEAVRLEADFARAAMLAALQLALCLALVGAMTALAPTARDEASAERQAERPDAGSRSLRLWDGAIVIGAGLLIAPPLLASLTGAANLPALADGEILRAAATSAGIALAAGLLACALALLLAGAGKSRLPEFAAFAMVGLPPFAFVAGLYVLLRGLADPASLGLALVPLVNALMALPYAWRLLAPPLAQSAERHGRLADSLGLSGWTRLRLVAWPLLRAPLAAAFALAAALSLGDFGVIALFGGGELVTLPYLLANRLGAYRIDEAAAIALLLVVSAGGLGYAAERWSGRHA
jgi:thiamine transport system permease protein